MSFFEDYVVGSTTELGRHRFTADEIIRFASAFDPQPFHVDEEAAANSHFGGLVASGWHTGAIMMKLLVEHRRRRLAEHGPGEQVGRIGPSPGFRDLKWLRPVRAGDTITYRSTVVEKRDWPKRPEWGLLTHLNEGFNQDGERVFAVTGHVLVERRTPVAAPEPAARQAG